MNIIKLNAIDSTNSYLKDLCGKKSIKDFTLVTTKIQTKGRGQIGTSWQSEKSKNLLCSVYKDCKSIPIKNQFYISIVTSLAIAKTLRSFYVPKIAIKWPNDILSEQKKICGILIENVIKQDKMDASIIGIGLNVNQTEFNNLPQASSIKNLTGKLFDVDEMMSSIINNLKWYFRFLENGKLEYLKEAYETNLFRMEKPSTFKDSSGKVFSGFIKGVKENGNLQISLEDQILEEFELKEIQLLY